MIVNTTITYSIKNKSVHYVANTTLYTSLVQDGFVIVSITID